MRSEIDAGRPKSDINVTPFVDIVFVLLIIFMVATPKILERVSLPKVERPEKRPTASNQIKMFVDYPAASLWIGEKRFEDEHARTELAAIHERSPQKDLVLLADARLELKDIKRAIRLADEAGFHSIGLIALQKPAN